VAGPYSGWALLLTVALKINQITSYINLSARNRRWRGRQKGHKKSRPFDPGGPMERHQKILFICLDGLCERQAERDGRVSPGRVGLGKPRQKAKFQGPRVSRTEGLECVENTGFESDIALSPHELGLSVIIGL